MPMSPAEIESLLKLENWPELTEEVKEKLREKARGSIQDRAEVYGHMSDEWVANRVRMLMRNDLMHEAICQASRDRIMRLSLQILDLKSVEKGMCDICGRGSCANWMHSTEEQQRYEKVIEAFDKARALREQIRDELKSERADE